ncbi:MAG: ribonuclease P protein component [Prevotella sp.]|nr:ribonuclease P protein component [Prevotella sp.]
MTPRQHTFAKQERLCSRKLIEKLFGYAGKSSVAVYPLRAVFATVAKEKEDSETVMVMVSVSKKHFKHAVDRNRVKRQIREAYRLNKDELRSTLQQRNAANADGQQTLVVAFIWMTDQHIDSKRVAGSMKELLRRIEAKLQ